MKNYLLYFILVSVCLALIILVAKTPLFSRDDEREIRPPRNYAGTLPPREFPPRRGWQGGRGGPQGEAPPFAPQGQGRRGGPGFENRGMARRQMMELRKEHPELADLIEELRRIDMQIDKVARFYQRADSPEKKENIAADLKRLVEKQFDLDHQRQTMEIEIMQSKIERVKELLKRQEKFKDELIEKRFQEVTDPDYVPNPQQIIPLNEHSGRGPGWMRREPEESENELKPTVPPLKP